MAYGREPAAVDPRSGNSGIHDLRPSVSSFTVIAIAFLYGLGFALKRNRTKQMREISKSTPLKTKIEQMLTEARVIIPGGQALLGFQLIETLTKAFNELPFKYVHCVGLCAVAFIQTAPAR